MGCGSAEVGIEVGPEDVERKYDQFFPYRSISVFLKCSAGLPASMRQTEQRHRH